MSIVNRPLRFSATVLVLSLWAVTSASAAEPAPGFADFKALAGDWVEVEDDGTLGTEVVTSFRVTAGGSAVLETLFAGKSSEMLTLYHEDAGELVLTHYCVAGNQPRMVAHVEGPGSVHFEHQGAHGVQSEAERHMHEAFYTWEADGRLRTEWRMTEAGEVVYAATFHLARKP